MKLLTVSVGTPKEVSYVDRKGRAKTTTTGIFKTPIDSRVMLRCTNLDGDGQADLEAHGGPDKAVYVYNRENYDFWAKELGRDILRRPVSSARTSTLKACPMKTCASVTGSASAALW